MILKTHYGEIGPMKAATVFRAAVDVRVYLLAAFLAVVLAGSTQFQCEGPCLDQTLMMVYRVIIGSGVFLTIGLMVYSRVRRIHLSYLCLGLALLSIAVVELVLFPLGMTQGLGIDLFLHAVVVPMLAIEAAIAIWWFSVRPSYERFVTGATDGAVSDVAGPSIVIDMTRLAVADIEEIRAGNRGVTLTVRGQEMIGKEAFSTVISRLPPGHGAQISRSLWVADRMFDSCDRSGKVLVIVLRDGTRHSIGSSRRAEVLDWASRLSLRPEAAHQR